MYRFSFNNLNSFSRSTPRNKPTVVSQSNRIENIMKCSYCENSGHMIVDCPFDKSLDKILSSDEEPDFNTMTLKTLKRIAVFGNLVTSFLIALTIFIVYVFEIKNTNTASNLSDEITNFFTSISVTIYIFIYIIFAFFMTLIREIIKNIEDLKGDYALKMNTLPILIGVKRTRNIVLVISSVVFVFILFIINSMIFSLQ